MQRDPAYLADMVLSARRAMEYLAGKQKEEFLTDPQCQDAVVRRLEVIGEAARRVSEATRLSLPNLPWTSLIGMRNILIHEYDGIDLAIVWETVKRDLPPLAAALQDFVTSD
jgi:uncharacterized protein with HEPN domain